MTELIEKYGANYVKHYSQNVIADLHRIVSLHVQEHFNSHKYAFDELEKNFLARRDESVRAGVNKNLQDSYIRSTTLFNCTWFTKDADTVHALVEKKVILTQQFVIELNELLRKFIGEKAKAFLELDGELSTLLNPAADYLIGKAKELRNSIDENKKQLLDLQVKKMARELDGVLPDNYSIVWLDEKN